MDSQLPAALSVQLQRSAGEIFGMNVNLGTADQYCGLIAEAIQARARIVIANHNLHSLYWSLRNGGMRCFFERAEFAHIDGMPLVFMLRALGYSAIRAHRVTYVDWASQIMEAAARQQWRVFYLGSSERALAAGLSALRERYPGLLIEGRHGFFDASADGSENSAVIAQIESFGPNVLLVGMGMPRQELWIDANRHKLTANVVLPCGAAIDYFAGQIPPPPRWAGQVGLEWLFRLIAEPRRLATRYLVEPWSLVIPFMTEVIRVRLRRWS